MLCSIPEHQRNIPGEQTHGISLFVPVSPFSPIFPVWYLALSDSVLTEEEVYKVGPRTLLFVMME